MMATSRSQNQEAIKSLTMGPEAGAEIVQREMCCSGREPAKP